MREREGIRRPGELRTWTYDQNLLDLVPVATFVTDANGQIVTANAAAVHLVGAEGLLSAKPLAVFMDDQRAFRSMLSEALRLEPNAAARRELTIRDRGGRRHYAAAVARRVVEDGSEARVAWAFTDIDARVALETELRVLAEELEGRVAQRTAELETERARVAAILDGMPAGVIVAEASSGHIVLTNERALRLLGTDGVPAASVDDYPRVEAYREDGTPLEPQDWPLARTLATGEPVSERIRVVRGDRSTVIEASSSPIVDQSGRVVNAVAVLSDVSERERRERIEREFVTNAAHELQTPIAAILAAVEVLGAGAKDVPEDRDRFLAHVEREAARLLRLARGLLALARAQLGTDAVSVERVSLRHLLDEVALGLRPRAGIEIRVRCPARLALTTNRDLLEQTLGNLAANAAHYTREGSIELRASRRRGNVTIDVVDTGAGIADEERERVFDRFYRSGPRTGEGFGLGLSIVRQAVDVLGGSVSLVPTDGGGTTARIVLADATKGTE